VHGDVHGVSDRHPNTKQSSRGLGDSLAGVLLSATSPKAVRLACRQDHCILKTQTKTKKQTNKQKTQQQHATHG
jgi:hypothetical protein